MPKPVYILAAQSWSLDQESGLSSYFHVVEGYEFTILPIDSDKHRTTIAQLSETANFVCVAVWMKTDGDLPSDEFEFVLSLLAPGKPEFVIAKGSFRFTKTFQRIGAKISLASSPPGSGVMYLESRIRKTGATQWLKQEFPIPVTVRSAESVAEQVDS